MAKQFETNVGNTTETTREGRDPDRTAGGKPLNPKFLDRDDPNRPPAKYPRDGLVSRAPSRGRTKQAEGL